VTPTSISVPEGMDRQRLGELDVFLRRHPQIGSGGRTRLVGADGETVEVPTDVVDILHQVTSALLAGDGVAISPVSPELTVGEAVRLTGARRADVIAALPSHRVGYQRRFYLPDVLSLLGAGNGRQGARESENLPLP
jgi:hypothetical protein